MAPTPLPAPLDPSLSRRGLLALIGLAPLAACGFTPLYGEGSAATAIFGKVDVAPLDGAAGFAMRERLTGRLGPATAATHRLEVDLTLATTGVALTQENVTTRYDVTGVAVFRLMPLTGGPPALSGMLTTVTGYSAPASSNGSAFAIRAAEQDAEQRVALTLADQIVERLALTSESWM